LMYPFDLCGYYVQFHSETVMYFTQTSYIEVLTEFLHYFVCQIFGVATRISSTYVIRNVPFCFNLYAHGSVLSS